MPPSDRAHSISEITAARNSEGPTRARSSGRLSALRGFVCRADVPAALGVRRWRGREAHPLRRLVPHYQNRSDLQAQ